MSRLEDSDTPEAHIIQEVLEGRLPLNGAKVQGLSEPARLYLDELLKVDRALKDEAELEAELVSQVDQMSTDDDAPAFAEKWRDVVQSQNKPLPSKTHTGIPRRVLGALFAAAGLSLLAYALGWPSSEEREPWTPGEGTLSSQVLSPPLLETPIQDRELEAPELKWTGQLPDGMFFQVRIWESDSSRNQIKELPSSPRLFTHGWRPATLLPTHFLWQVDVIGLQPKPLASSQRMYASIRP